MESLVRINASVFVFFFFVIVIFISLGKGGEYQGQLSLGGNDDNNSFGFVSAFTLTAFHSKSSTSSSSSSFSSLLPLQPYGRAVSLWSYNGDDDKNKNIPNGDSVVSYKSIIDILSNADYMDVETKNRFLTSLKKEFPDVVFNDDAIIIDNNNSTAKEKSSKEAETKKISISGGGSVMTIEGPWKDDGGPFHTTGAWQTKPLLMRGAFLDDITRNNNNSSSSSNSDEEEEYPFPVWSQIIHLACHGSENKYDDDDDDDDNYDDNYDHPNEVLDPGYEHDVHDPKDNDESNDNEMEFDDYNDEDEDEDGYLWKDEDDDYEDYDNGDNNDFAPSRIIQYAWPQRDDQEDNYYHADVNHSWLDTFEIKQFGPFDSQNSVETLLRGAEDSSKDENANNNNNNNSARTLLVNDADRWFPKLSQWMDRRFNNAADGIGSVLPARWRRDDAQISLSYKSGGIGPHVDDYDVFLIQIEGERTWDILWDDDDDTMSSFVSVQDETDCILPESSVNGVRILNVTKLQALQQQRYGHKTATKLTRLHLRPGDCLYLPPRVLHCGTAICSESSNGGCMTLSVGCRAPSASDLVDGLSDLMKKAAITPTTDDNATATMPTILSTDTALQSFHKRYTNTEINRDDENDYKDNARHYFEDKSNASIPPSSWLSPKVKKEMKDLVLDAVRTALDDDENVLDPLIGKFVTRSNRLEENDFGGDGSSDDSLFSSFSYPKPLRNILEEDWNDEMDTEEWKEEFKIWTNVSETMKEVFKEPVTIELDRDIACLRRAEGIAFAWSFVYDKERGVRKYRLYAQGRPPFEVLEIPVVVPDETADNSSKQSMISSPSSSVVGQLMNRIANGQPLDRAFVVDELKIRIDDVEKNTKYTVTRLLYDLVEEGLLYGEYSNHLGLVRRGQWAKSSSEDFSYYIIRK